MGQRVLSLIISDTPPTNAKGSLWIKYVRKTNSYQIMLPVPHGWIAAGPTNDYVNQIIDRMLNPYPDVDDGSGSGSTGGAFNSSFNQSYEISGGGADPRVEATANKVTEINENSTDKQYPSAKAVYEYIQQLLQNPSDFNDDFNDDFGGETDDDDDPVDLSDVIKYTEQTPTTAQQSQARKNIGIGIVDDTMPVDGMLPNVLYELGELDNDTEFVLAAPVEGEVNHYYWTFDAANDITITWPADILIWNGDDAPEITAGNHYEISVLNGVGAWLESSIPTEPDAEELA